MEAAFLDELIKTLQDRFAKNKRRHTGIDWISVQAKLEASPEKLQALYEMEHTGGEPDETGLITGGELTVPVVVISLQEAEANVGLNEMDVLREVELRLLRHGIIPADREAAHALGCYLGVDLLIAGSAYHVKVGFYRRGTYDVGDQTYGKEGITWQIWYTGVHEGDSEIIIDSLLECVDDFSSEFLEVNIE